MWNLKKKFLIIICRISQNYKLTLIAPSELSTGTPGVDGTMVDTEDAIGTGRPADEWEFGAIVLPTL